MRISDHVSMAAIATLLFIVVFVALCHADTTVTYPAADGVNIVTVHTDDLGVATSSTTTALALGDVQPPTNAILVVDTNADYVAGESSLVLVTPELRGMAGQMFGGNADTLLHAIQLQMAKYDLDMAKPEGRRSWHGKLIREDISTNSLCKVEVYSNELTGAVWRYRTPFTPVPKVTTNRHMKVTYTTNGIPVGLARARARRAAQLNGEVETTNIVKIANSAE